MTNHFDLSVSIVDYLSDHSGYRCGYCKSEDTNFSHGMWSYKLSVQDYQNLIDRGWRRSGKYCYKPTMDKTCCPQYTIRCNALEFKLSKSQKKVLKRMHAYLSYGTIKKSESNSEAQSMKYSELEPQCHPRNHAEKNISGLEVEVAGLRKLQQDTQNVVHDQSAKKLCSEFSKSEQENSSQPHLPSTSPTPSTKETEVKVKPGLGRDTSKPPPKKAKIIRMERRAAKLASRDGSSKQSLDSPKKSKVNEAKSLQDFLNEPLPDTPAHRLELRLVQVNENNSSFSRTFKSSYEVFRTYQMTIHQDPPNECEEFSFKNFLVDGPLTPWKPSTGPPYGYGPFHQQYWLDGQLIAIGVIDILPSCVSSVYFYYDPKFSFLSLGTYASLREIALTKELNRTAPNLMWYYMGFYIHSCPKMRYKGSYYPSFLLCPETYEWVPIENCVKLLDNNKYSRLYSSTISKEELDINRVSCLYHGRTCLYGKLRRLQNGKDVDAVQEYLDLAGAKAAYSMLLYRE